MIQMALGSIERRGKNSWRLIISAGSDSEGKRVSLKKTIRANTRKDAEIDMQ